MKKSPTAKRIRRKIFCQAVLSALLCVAVILVGVTQLNYLEMDVYFLGCIFVISGGIAVRIRRLKGDIYQSLLEMAPDSTKAEAYASEYFRYNMFAMKFYMVMSALSLIGSIMCAIV